MTDSSLKLKSRPAGVTIKGEPLDEFLVRIHKIAYKRRFRGEPLTAVWRSQEYYYYPDDDDE